MHSPVIAAVDGGWQPLVAHGGPLLVVAVAAAVVVAAAVAAVVDALVAGAVRLLFAEPAFALEQLPQQGVYLQLQASFSVSL